MHERSRCDVRTLPHGYIRSYLNNKLQCAMANCCKSDSVPVTSGISKIMIFLNMILITYQIGLLTGFSPFILIDACFGSCDEQFA